MDKARREKGFTLVEVIIALAIFGIIFWGMYGMLRSSTQYFRSNSSVEEAEQDVYFGMEMLTRELREARQINYYNNELVNFTDQNGIVITYTIQGTQLVRQQGALTEIVTGNIATINDLYIDPHIDTTSGKYRFFTIIIKATVNDHPVTLQNSVYPH